MNAIVASQRIDSHPPPRLKLLGRYDASDLQRAMRVALGRAHLRELRTPAPRVINCDIRPDGRRIEL